MSNKNSKKSTTKNTSSSVKARKKSRKKKSKFPKWLTAIVLVAVIVFSVVCYLNPTFYNNVLSIFNGESNDGGNKPPQKPSTVVENLNDVLVHFIDVGQADSILIELPDGKNVLIDAGDNVNKYKEHMVNYINDAIKEDGEEQGVIDYLISTHSDSDHIGGMQVIFENFQIKKVFRPYILYSGEKYTFSQIFNKGNSKSKVSTNVYGSFLKNIIDEDYIDEIGQSKDCEWEFFTCDSDFGGSVIHKAVTYEYNFDFLAPSTDFSGFPYNTSNVNDYSPLIKFTYQDYSILFTGDAEEMAEDEFVKQYSIETLKDYVDVDLLKVGHHGAETSSQESFLNLIKPEVAIICCGEGNKHEHPRQSTLNKFKNLFNSYESGTKTALFRTDLHGDIVVQISSSSRAEFHTQKTDVLINDIFTGADAL